MLRPVESDVETCPFWCQNMPAEPKSLRLIDYIIVCQQKKTFHVFPDRLYEFHQIFNILVLDIFLYAILSYCFKCPPPAPPFLRCEGPTRASSLSATKRAAEVYGRDLHRRPSPCRLRPVHPANQTANHSRPHLAVGKISQ